jgi:hypothetical protein
MPLLVTYTIMPAHAGGFAGVGMGVAGFDDTGLVVRGIGVVVGDGIGFVGIGLHVVLPLVTVEFPPGHMVPNRVGGTRKPALASFMA